MLPSSLWQLLRDASWIDAPVELAAAFPSSSPPSPSLKREAQCGRADAAPAPSDAAPEGGRLSGDGGACLEDGLGRGRRSARALSRRRSLGLLGPLDFLSEEDRSPPKQLAAPPPSDPADPAAASVKLACHLSEGVAVLVSDGFLGLWLGVLSIPSLQECLRVSAPAVALPMQEVLRRLERCAVLRPTPSEKGDGEGEAEAEEEQGEDAGSLCVVAPTEQDARVFGRRGRGSDADKPLLSAPRPETVVVRLSSPVTVLRGYELPLVVPVGCTRLAMNGGGGSAPRRPPALCWEAVFHEMVLEPQRAFLVALSEALLLLCAECGRRPPSVAARMTAVYQRRYRDAVLTAQDRVDAYYAEKGGVGDGQGGAEAVWEAHKEVAASLIRGLQAPPALLTFHSFAVDLLRFAKAEANRLVEGPAGTVGHGCQGRGDAPAPLLAAEGKRPTSPATAAAAAAVSALPTVTEKKRPRPEEEGESRGGAQGALPPPPSAEPLRQPPSPPPPPPPLPVKLTTAEERDAERKRRKVRKLFS